MKFSFSFVLRQEGLELTLILNLREIPQSQKNASRSFFTYRKFRSARRIPEGEFKRNAFGISLKERFAFFFRASTLS